MLRRTAEYNLPAQSGACLCPKSMLQGVQDGRSGKFYSAFVIVTEAFTRADFLQCAAKVIFAVNDDPAAIDLDAFQGRVHILVAGVRSLVARGLTPATHGGNWLAVDLLAKEFVIRWYGLELP